MWGWRLFVLYARHIVGSGSSTGNDLAVSSGLCIIIFLITGKYRLCLWEQSLEGPSEFCWLCDGLCGKTVQNLLQKCNDLLANSLVSIKKHFSIYFSWYSSYVMFQNYGPVINAQQVQLLFTESLCARHFTTIYTLSWGHWESMEEEMQLAQVVEFQTWGARPQTHPLTVC